MPPPDASRFLAQSQSRISFLQPKPDNPSESPRNPLERQRGRNAGPSRFASSRSYLQRPTLPNPYQPTGSGLSQFPFASRSSNQPAPLFYSATDEFREEDDELEREREVADFYALQRSRRQFGASQLEESSEIDEDQSRESLEGDDGRASDDRGFGRGGGIKSSWRGGRSAIKDRGRAVQSVTEEAVDRGDGSSNGSSKGKSPMVNIGLESIINESSTGFSEHDGSPPDDLAIDMPPDEDPPAFQQFTRPPVTSDSRYPKGASFLPYETSREDDNAFPRPSSPESESVPPSMSLPSAHPPRHDSFWASLFLICLGSLFATFFLVFLHTSPPSRKHPLGDTIYTTLHSSYHLLAVDTLVAVVVSLLWLSLLRSFVRPLVLLILVAVPVILISFSIYPLVSSYKGKSSGKSLQDKAMRWLSLLPAIAAVGWTYTVFRARHSFNKAIGILEFSCRILAANPALLALGLGTLGSVVVWTWVWMGMFSRVFLGGHISTSKHLFIIDPGSWWLGVYFVLMYLWTLAVISGIQRAATAATVSQWYFHRLAIPAPTSQQIVVAALNHSTTTQLGTTCLSTLLALMARLPLLVLPRRLIVFIGLFTYSFIPTSVAALMNPLTLTHAAIHSQPLAASAVAVSQMNFLLSSTPTTSLHPRAFASRSTAPLLPYRLAKLLLHSTRLIMSLALGFGGWVSTAKMLVVEGAGVRGSLYAYVVGLIAGAIGWGVLGAMEGVLGTVVDGALLCWASEGRGGSGGGYCLEANYLFGEAR